jgi:hypothetical protein
VPDDHLVASGQPPPDDSHGRVLAALFALALGSGSLLYAFLAGSGGPPRTSAWLGGTVAGLGVSAFCGVAAMACLLKALARRARLPLLALGLLPAAVQGVVLLAA